MVNAYPEPAPAFEDNESKAVIIGYATTYREAMELYRVHYAGTGAVVLRAKQVTVTRRGEGDVDGWAPSLVADVIYG